MSTERKIHARKTQLKFLQMGCKDLVGVRLLKRQINIEDRITELDELKVQYPEFFI